MHDNFSHLDELLGAFIYRNVMLTWQKEIQGSSDIILWAQFKVKLRLINSDLKYACVFSLSNEKMYRQVAFYFFLGLSSF